MNQKDSDVIENNDKGVREISKPFASNANKKDKKPQEKIVEKVVYVDRDRRGIFAKLKRTFTFFGCLPLLILCFFFTYVIFTQTDPFWGSIVDTLNSGSEYELIETDVTPQQAQVQFESQITELGENTVTLTDEQMTVLARQNLSELSNISVNSNIDTLRIYWNIDDNEDPLLGRIDVALDNEGNPEITYVGFNRIGAPANVSRSLSEALFPLLQFTYGSRSTQELLSFLLTGNENNELSNIQFEDNQATFTIDISVDIFE